MKFLILCSSILVSNVAAAASTHSVVLYTPIYYGNTLLEMTDSLQEQLAEKITTVCGESAEAVKMHTLSIDFKRGKAAGTGPLDARILKNGDRLLVDFPMYPQAVLTATLECI